jgi:hypothetical protein
LYVQDIAKLLAGRLKLVLGKLISEVQSSFLPNRQILDGVVNELLDLAKRRNDKCLMFKVDFERAYDTVDWNFFGLHDGQNGLCGRLEEVDSSVCFSKFNVCFGKWHPFRRL